MSPRRGLLLALIAAAVAALAMSRWRGGVSEREERQPALAHAPRAQASARAPYPHGLRPLAMSAALAAASVLVTLADGQGARAVSAGTTEVISSGTSARLTGNSSSYLVDQNSSPRAPRSLSTTGRYVAFESDATNLVSGDTNGTTDVFVLDRDTGVVERVSVASDGTEANGASHSPSISGDGNVVAFTSVATNLSGLDTNGVRDVFIRRRDVRQTARVSVTSNGEQANGASDRPAIAKNGWSVVFETSATNLINTTAVGIVLRDLIGASTEAVSISTAGTLANGASSSPAVSADGSRVVFVSAATNLVAGDTNAIDDVFLRDRSAGTTTRITVAADGTESGTSGFSCGCGSYTPVLSADGRFVAFASDEPELLGVDGNGDPVDLNGGLDDGVTDIFVVDIAAWALGSAGSVQKLSDQAGGASYAPAISDDGGIVAFLSDGDGLVAGDSNGLTDVFVYDRDPAPGSFIRRTSASNESGAYDVALSGDGAYVAFDTDATDLVGGAGNGENHVYVTTVGDGTIALVSASAPTTIGNGYSDVPSVSDDGRWVAFASDATNLVSNDTNAATDVFLYDRDLGVMARISVTSAGAQSAGGGASPSMSTDGRYIAFETSSALIGADTNGQFDVYVYDRQTGALERVSVAGDGTQANGASSAASISADGRYVAFVSLATDLVTGDTNAKADVFVRDRTGGTTERVSVASDGTQAIGSAFQLSTSPAISGDGRYVAFVSDATNLVSGDSNAKADVFVRDRTGGTTERVSVASDGTEATGPNVTPFSSGPAMSYDGRYVVYSSYATNLVSGDTNALADVFIRDRTGGTTERVSVTSAGAQATGGHSYSPTVSADGRYVAFDSSATDLVTGDTNALNDVFVRDRTAGTTARASLTTAGAQMSDGDSYTARIAANASSLVFASTSGLLAGSVANDGQVFFHALIEITPTVTPTPSPSPTPTPTPAPTAAPAGTASASPAATATSTPEPQSTAPPSPEATPVPLPETIDAAAPPLVLVDLPVAIPSAGIVTQPLRLETKGAVVEIAAGVTVLVDGKPASVTLLPPVVRSDGDTPTVELTTADGRQVSFEPPIEITLDLPALSSSASALAQAGAADGYVPVEIADGGEVTGCLPGTRTPTGIRFTVSRVGRFALRGPERPEVRLAMPRAVVHAAGIHSRYVGGTVTTLTCPGQVVHATVLLLNAGSESWIRGTATEIVLGTSSPPGNTRDLDAGILVDPPYNRDRVAVMSEDLVGPGSIATFSFRIRAPGTPGAYLVHARPVVEGVGWLADEGIYAEIQVRHLTGTGRSRAAR